MFPALAGLNRFVCDSSGDVTLTLRQSVSVNDVVLNADFSKFISSFQDSISTVVDGSIECNSLGLVRFTLNQSEVQNPVVITGDFSKFLNSGLTETEVVQVVRQETDELDQCLTGFDVTIQGGRASFTIDQRNCQPVSAFFDFPVVDDSGDVVSQVAPSRARGLKRALERLGNEKMRSRLHGRVD